MNNKDDFHVFALFPTPVIHFDLPGSAERDSLLSIMREQEKILLLPCGPRSIRFRPALTISTEELSTGLKGLDRALGRLGNTGATSTP